MSTPEVPLTQREKEFVAAMLIDEVQDYHAEVPDEDRAFAKKLAEEKFGVKFPDYLSFLDTP